MAAPTAEIDGKQAQLGGEGHGSSYRLEVISVPDACAMKGASSVDFKIRQYLPAPFPFQCVDGFGPQAVLLALAQCGDGRRSVARSKMGFAEVQIVRGSLLLADGLLHVGQGA